MERTPAWTANDQFGGERELVWIIKSSVARLTMKIDTEKCIGCGQCQAYCPMGAIIESLLEEKTVSEVVQEECVECGCV